MLDSTIEKRHQVRERRSDPIWWRPRAGTTFAAGWLLESSDDGLAFAVRGAEAPRQGAIIEIAEIEPALDARESIRRAVVRRVNCVHDDLLVIAVQIFQTTAFPPRERERTMIEPRIEADQPAGLAIGASSWVSA